MASPAEVFSVDLIETVCDQSLTPREELGQNFLVDWGVLADEADYADVGRDDSVLEVGPGLGQLTCVLADRAGSVVAVEKDERFRPMLERIVADYGNVRTVYADALDHDLRRLDFEKVVANLPFGVSLPLLFELLEAGFETAVVVVQDDLADRVTKSPGESGYNRLSVQFYRVANVHRLGTVDREAFYPPPDVDGAILRIDDVAPKFEVPSEEFFKDTLMFLFAQRDQPVRTALLALSDVGPVTVTPDDLAALDADLLDRPVEEVRSREFGQVARLLRERYGEAVRTAFERFYDERGLYERARGETS